MEVANQMPIPVNYKFFKNSVPYPVSSLCGRYVPSLTNFIKSFYDFYSYLYKENGMPSESFIDDICILHCYEAGNNGSIINVPGSGNNNNNNNTPNINFGDPIIDSYVDENGNQNITIQVPYTGGNGINPTVTRDGTPLPVNNENNKVTVQDQVPNGSPHQYNVHAQHPNNAYPPVDKTFTVPPVEDCISYTLTLTGGYTGYNQNSIKLTIKISGNKKFSAGYTYSLQRYSIKNGIQYMDWAKDIQITPGTNSSEYIDSELLANYTGGYIYKLTVSKEGCSDLNFESNLIGKNAIEEVFSTYFNVNIDCDVINTSEGRILTLTDDTPEKTITFTLRITGANEVNLDSYQFEDIMTGAQTVDSSGRTVMPYFYYFVYDIKSDDASFNTSFATFGKMRDLYNSNFVKEFPYRAVVNKTVGEYYVSVHFVPIYCVSETYNDDNCVLSTVKDLGKISVRVIYDSYYIVDD